MTGAQVSGTWHGAAWAVRRIGQTTDAESTVRLSEPELRKASGFARTRERTRYLAPRILARTWTAGILGVDPRDVELAQGPCPACGGVDHGQPYVQIGTERLCFSLSRSGDLCALALSAGPVGIDVESLDRHVDIDAITSVSFSSRETCRLAGLEGRERQTAFLRMWTAKEAVTKTTGWGLRADFKDVDECGPGLWQHDRRQWSVHHIDGQAIGAVAAVATPSVAERHRQGQGLVGDQPVIVR